MKDTTLSIGGISVKDVDGISLTTTLMSRAARSTDSRLRRHHQRRRQRDHDRHPAQINAALAGLAYTGKSSSTAATR